MFKTTMDRVVQGIGKVFLGGQFWRRCCLSHGSPSQNSSLSIPNPDNATFSVITGAPSGAMATVVTWSRPGRVTGYSFMTKLLSRAGSPMSHPNALSLSNVSCSEGHL